MNMNNFIALTPNDIIIYNHIQSKIYKYFILHHKKYNFIIDDNNNDTNNDDDIKYCKNFKFNVCLCYRNKNNINNYSKIYNCPNNKRILYNINNFNFLNPISVSINNEKIYPIDIFTYYRQEYLPFIINEKFTKYKNNQSKLLIFNKNKLLKIFNIIKSYQNNYHFLKYNFNVFKKSFIKSLNKYNDIIIESKKNELLKTFNILKSYQNNHHFLKYNFNVFKKSYIKSLNKYDTILEESKKNELLKTFNILKLYQNNHHFLKYNFNVFKKSYKLSLNKKLCISYNNTYNNNSYYNDLVDVFNNNPISKNIATQTEEQPTVNYSLIIAIILNDYTNLIGDYNDFIISLLKR